MTSNQIQCFLAAAKVLSFSKAGEELFLAQSSVSRSISQLEEEWGVRLFERTGKTVVLTEEGEDYVRLCSRCEADFQRLRQRHRARREQSRLTLQYAVFPAWNISRLMYENTEQIQARHPGWEITMKFCPAEHLVDSLRSGEVDLIFHFGSMLERWQDVSVCPLLMLPQVILYSASDPLAGKKDISPPDFRNREFLYVPDGQYTPEMVRRQIRGLEKRYGFSARTRAVAGLDELAVALESGQGVALMDYWSRYRGNPQLKSLAVDLLLPVVLGWRSDCTDPMLHTFVKETSEFFQNNVE